MQSIPKLSKPDTTERIVELLREIVDAQQVAFPSETVSLFEAGVLDSFGMLEFLTTLEEEFNIRIPEDDLVPSNFETIAKISRYVSELLGR